MSGETDQPKVTVVVPVYNPGEHIEDLIASLLRQSLPADEYEAVFVDDGSTDETPARLDALAAEHANIQVIHQENSGWPGKPRNVGVDAARGRYVYFCDNDDYLGDEALERMYDYAEANGADIVIGKMAGRNRGVPRELFNVDRPNARLGRDPLIDSLTPHKLFRTEFLRSNELRFPEGRRRLEDHVFVTAAYFAAERISVLSNYVCYYHVRRDDASNAGYVPIDPPSYFRYMCEALDVVEQNTEPGPLRDRLYRRWLRVEMVGRLRSRRFLAMSAAQRTELATVIRDIVIERFEPSVDAGLAPPQRLITQLLRTDRLSELGRLGEWEGEIGGAARLDDLRWRDGVLSLSVAGELTSARRAMEFVHRDGRDMLLPDLPDDVLADIDDEMLDATQTLAKSNLQVLVKHRGTGTEHLLPVTGDAETEPVESDPGGGVRFRQILTGEARFDPQTVAGGKPLSDGEWQVFVRIRSLGFVKDVRVSGTGAADWAELSEQCVPAVVGKQARLVAPYWSGAKRHLVVEVGRTGRNRLRPAGADEARSAGDLAGLGDSSEGLAMRVPLSLHLAGEAAATIRLRHGDKLGSGAGDDAVELEAAIRPVSPIRGDLTARVPRARLAAGKWRLAVRVGDPGVGDGGEDAAKFVDLPLAVEVTDEAEPRLLIRRQVAQGPAPAPKRSAPAANRGPAGRTVRFVRRKLGRLRRAAGRRLGKRFGALRRRFGRSET